MAELELQDGAAGDPAASLSERPSGPPAQAPEPPEAGVMTLVEHLDELRRRLFISVGALIVTSIVGFIVAPYLIDAIDAPFRDQLQILTVGGGFFVQVKLALIIGLALALPVVVIQLWRFVAPGLTVRERAAIRPWLPLAAVFFALGVGVAYVVFP
ncbi:MAG: twin-arginine translocase subunit TatC, partial [Candidatus Limnocylindrales bacterium]